MWRPSCRHVLKVQVLRVLLPARLAVLLATAAATAALAADPSISDVSIAQLSNRLVSVSYTLSNAASPSSADPSPRWRAPQHPPNAGARASARDGAGPSPMPESTSSTPALGRQAATSALFLCRDKPGRHVVEVVALPEKDEASIGYGCHLTGLLVTESR